MVIMLPFLASCGFQPLYATPDEAGAHSLIRQIKVTDIISTRDAGEGNLAVQPILRKALENRLLVSQRQSEDYLLVVRVTPRARRQAVQLDASVSRFNYELLANYRLVHRETGAYISGYPSSLVAFTQVTAQYASLYSERSAVIKASERLAIEIERDILLQADRMEAIIADARLRNEKPEKDPTKFDETDMVPEFDPDFDPELIPDGP